MPICVTVELQLEVEPDDEFKVPSPRTKSESETKLSICLRGNELSVQSASLAVVCERSQRKVLFKFPGAFEP